MSLLTVTGISKQYEGNFLLRDISFIQQSLQKIAIAGETGSGKTTLMKIIAGLGQADSGDVLFGTERVKGVYDKLMPGHPGIAYLSQHFELPNNYRVEEVLSYANKLTDTESVALFEVCRIDHLLLRKTNTLSGGEKQRVALARLLTHAPKLLLLDEPFSNMDLIHKNILKQVVDDVHQRLGVTCMLISHDADDILPWADEVFVMKEGQIVQQGSPKEIYGQPVNEYVAGLFGKYTLLTPSLSAALGSPAAANYIRPEDFIIVSSPDKGARAVVTFSSYFGSHNELQVLLAGHNIIVKNYDHNINVGDSIYVAVSQH